MRLLYVANHAVLEYDELRLLSAAGFTLFSTGHYQVPSTPTVDIRPTLPDISWNAEAWEIWQAKALTVASFADDSDFLRCFDAVIWVHFDPQMPQIAECAEKIPVVIRTIGQTTLAKEQRLAKWRKRYKIVRYSPREENIPGYAGADAMIRFGKEPGDFRPWVGDSQSVYTFFSGLPKRPRHGLADEYDRITQGFPRKLFGGGNQSLSWSAGPVPCPKLADIYSDAGVYYCCHTIPASYTLNLMEAMLAGCPIVTVGYQMIEAFSRTEGTTAEAYEVPELLNGVEFDLAPGTITGARYSIAALLGNRKLAGEIGSTLRARAIDLFGREKIASQWRDFLNRL